MKQVSILYNNKTILNRVWLADSFITRLKGLMFRKTLEENEGMLITPCRQIHTFFMKFPIDVLFINREGIVQEAITDMPSGRVSSFVKTGISVLEMKAGMIKKYSIDKGSFLEIGKEEL
jgi:uncharacterized membrane protein (UPF0127 family)